MTIRSKEQSALSKQGWAADQFLRAIEAGL